MNAIPALMLLAMATASTGAAAAQDPRTPIRPFSNCIRIEQINEWHVIDDRTATVRTGPIRYRVDLQSACPQLGLGPPGLLFRPNRSNQALGESRICGEVGETVQSRDQPPCAIQSVSIIDKTGFDALSDRARRNGSGADQATSAHRP
jgi:hypothetical protein